MNLFKRKIKTPELREYNTASIKRHILLFLCEQENAGRGFKAIEIARQCGHPDAVAYYEEHGLSTLLFELEGDGLVFQGKFGPDWYVMPDGGNDFEDNNE